MNFLNLKDQEPINMEKYRSKIFTMKINKAYNNQSIKININRQLKKPNAKNPFVVKDPVQSEDVVSDKIYSIIPLNLFQTWYTLDLPLHMKKNVELLKKQNPKFKYELYDDAMCREFIKDNFDKDVVYAFDKLKPGAFKADLWRYCILYVKGGIYLDIKYHCINGFKLLTLTDKEYWVKDREQFNKNGIYQALMVCLPRNNILRKSIDEIVQICKYSIYYNDNLYEALDYTGPGLLANYFKTNYINNFALNFNGKSILFNGKPILGCYREYRNEQISDPNTRSKYYELVLQRELYNYPILKPEKSFDYSKIIHRKINNRLVKLYCSTPTIIEYDNDSYLINFRWINSNCVCKDGRKIDCPKQGISVNSKIIVDSNFSKKNDEIFLEADFIKEQNYPHLGLEDIRIFKFKDNYYYISTYFDEKRNITSVSSSIFNINDNSYKLKNNIILSNNYDTTKINIIEKNWSFFEYNNELCVVYMWHPLQIGKINYNTNKMDIIEIKYNVPNCFTDIRGTTCGYIINNEIWFVLHKCISNQKYKYNRGDHSNNNNTTYYNYQHCFAVFDLNMNLLRFSEMFKLGGCKVEFCTGLIVKEDKVILSYSLLDIESKVSIYAMDTINNSIRWYDNNTELINK